MDNPLAKTGAAKIVTICAGVRRGESVVVVAEDGTLPVADALDLAARSAGADSVVCRMQTRQRHGQEPPPPVAAALAAADVFFTPVSVSITHTRAIKAAVARGARGLVMTGVTPAMLEHGGIDANFDKQAGVCRRLAAIFQSGESAHLTTPGGTDLRMSLKGRRGNALTGIVSPGEFSTFPTIEANVSPVEGSARGVLVADASVPYLGIGVLQEPVRAEVAAGYITDIRGGREPLAEGGLGVAQ